jgi:hypothetical protein
MANNPIWFEIIIECHSGTVSNPVVVVFDNEGKRQTNFASQAFEKAKSQTKAKS